MANTYRIPSKLYAELYNTAINSNSKLDADRLIAMYSILKQSRLKGETKYQAFTSRNNKVVSGYSLLRNKTNMSLVTLKKYIPALINLNLCYFDKKGDFIVIGNDKLKATYNDKIIPILIGKNIIETALNVFYVRLHASEKNQIKRIKIKTNQSELLKQIENPTNTELYKKAKSFVKRNGNEIKLIDKCVLSIKGYAGLKKDSSCKGLGNYWKRRLKSKKLIKTKRRFDIIQEMDFKEFQILKSSKQISGKYIYYDGYLVEELASEFSVISQCKNSTPTKTNQYN